MIEKTNWKIGVGKKFIRDFFREWRNIIKGVGK